MIGDLVKKISKHTLIYNIENVVSRTVGFLMIPVYTHYLTPSDYGVIELLDLTTYIIAMIIGAGMSSAVMRFYYAYSDQADRHHVISTALVFTFLLQLVSVITLYFLSDEISLVIFETDHYSPYFHIIFLTLCCSVLNQLIFSYIRAKQHSMTFTLFSLLRLTLGLSLNIYLIVFLQMGIWGVLYSGVITGGILAVLLMTKTLWEVGIHFSYRKLKEMLRYGGPLIPAGLGMFVLTFADRFFLQRYATLSAVGTYSLGYKLGMIVSVLITSPFLLYWSASMYEVAEKKNAKELFARIQVYFAFVLIFASLGLSLFAEDAVRLLSPPEFWGASQVVPIIAFSYVFLGLHYFFEVGIHLEKKTQYLAYAIGGNAVLNLVLNYLLIPAYQAVGAAWATFLSFLVMAGGTYMFSQRLYRIQYEYSRILKMITVGVALYGVSRLVPPGPLLSVMTLKGLLLLSFPFLLLALNFYRREERETAIGVLSLLGGKVGIGRGSVRG